MKIFDIEGNTVVLNTQILGIPPFRELWRRDKTESKERAYKEISYVTFLCDTSLDNPYRNYKDEDRELTLKRDFIGNEEWEPDLLVNEAIEKFKSFQQTTNSRLLTSAKKAAEKLAEYFEGIDFKELDRNGKPVYSADSLMSNLGQLAKVTRSLKMLEDEVLKEQTEAYTAVGGSEIGEYEMRSIEDEFEGN